MDLVPQDVVDMACAIQRRFKDEFTEAWAANDGMRAGILVCEVAATAIWEERQRAAKAAVQN
ncbi:hypothetical protein [Mesorhizobium ciceri]|uniref:hypothetical protein n=1 Tax=Mesorhizobium TaxID=68287 RepID=UPI0004793ED2|nr:hypothetical protein [Mesorhizobium ciceri]